MLTGVSTYLPDLGAKNLQLIEIWRGLRPCTPDGLPFLGRSRLYDNLIVAAGHAMIGISLAPITGRLVSELLMREKPSIDLTPLRLDRFGKKWGSQS
jgi:D-amino-acid dehydrogenase